MESNSGMTDQTMQENRALIAFWDKAFASSEGDQVQEQDPDDWKALAQPAGGGIEPEPVPEPVPDSKDDLLREWIEYEQAEADRHLAKVAELKARRLA